MNSNQDISAQKNHSLVKYFLSFALIALSGMPFFTANNYYLIAAFSFSLVIFLLQNKKPHGFYVNINIILIMLILLQTATFKFISWPTTVGLFLRFSFPYLAIVIIGSNFAKYYIRLLYLLTIISFIFYIPTLLFPNFQDFLLNNIAPYFNQEINSDIYEYNSNILIYTINTIDLNYGLVRNSGPFWEPGAFAGFLVLGIMFNTLKDENIVNKYNIVFIIALISTYSTGGFIAIFTYAFFSLLLKERRKLALFFLPLLLYFAYQGYRKIDFIGDRINTQIQYTQLGDVSNTRRDRMVSAMLDIKDIVNHPLIGKGRNLQTRFEINTQHTSYREHRNNGLTDFIVKFGIPFSFIYFYFIHKSLNFMCKLYNRDRKYSFYILITIFTLGFSQGWFTKSIYIGLFYYYLTFYNQSVVIKTAPPQLIKPLI